MKEITEAITKLSEEKIKDLSNRLMLKKVSDKDILSALLSITGLHAIFSEISIDELRILKLIYNVKDGITFGEIEKELDINASIVAHLADNLSSKLLVYTIKNRQLLTNKLDKIYGITEISNFINIVDIENIKDKLDLIQSNLKNIKSENKLPIKDDPKILHFLKYMVNLGCIITLEEAKDVIPEQELNTILLNLMNNNIIYIVHNLHPRFNTYLILNEKIAPSIVKLIIDGNINNNVHVHNRYNFLINILFTYDTISTYGLFLTKQLEFRKIDKKRIAETSLKIFDFSGEEISSEDVSQLALNILNKINCLILIKDIANISLGKIQKDIDNPIKLTMKILKSINNISDDDKYFNPPFELPPYKYIQFIIKFLHEIDEVSFNYLKITMLTALLNNLLANMGNRSIEDCLSERENEINTLHKTLHFLCIIGIIEIKNGLFTLSDIGKEIGAHTLKLNITAPLEHIQKCIYINPDFTLILPINELNSLTLYLILTHTEIIKQDFILNALISKQSIVKAHKRGMSLKKFLETLKAYSKNDLPQNLDFLLTEWSNQTLKINITQYIILHSSHASFIDELLFGKIKEGVIERISDNYIIIKKDFIDEIIKFAYKKDAVITLFNSFEEED